MSASGDLGTSPRWSRTGDRLYYIKVSGFDVQSADIDTRKGFQAETPRRLFAAPPPLVSGWAPTPDDKRFLFATTPNRGVTAPFTVMLNWGAALKK